MEARDLFVTPLIIILVFLVAYFIRPYATDENTRRYFFPALILKIIGAITLGFIYQFYYKGGDTFNYHAHGSRIIWQAFSDDFFVGLKLFFSNGEFINGAYKYITQIFFYKDESSFAVVRIAAFFDLFTYSTYSASAVFFALISFSGGWAMFITFYKKYPHLHWPIAIATLFIPSVIFWGSGILKDTIILAAIGFAVYCVDQIFIYHRFKLLTFVMLLGSLYIIMVIRKFVLHAFIPSVILWIYYKHLIGLKSFVLRIIIAPIVVLIIFLTSYFSVIKVGEGDSKYSIEKLAQTAKVTAYDIRYWTGHDAGSGYSLGELDGSFSSIFRLAPQAINAALFRPYLWEVKNVLMLLSSIEGLIFFMVTVFVLLRHWSNLKRAFTDPNVAFCFLFSIAFAFAVGVSTFNFGTLGRYKTPLLPFYLLGIVLSTNGRLTTTAEIHQ